MRDETSMLHRNIVRSGTDIRRGYAQTSKGKKLKGEMAYPKLPHLPWQLHRYCGNYYLARSSSANTSPRCLRQEPRVHYGYCLIETAPKLHLPIYCCPIFSFLFILLDIRSLNFYFYCLTTFVVMQQVSRHTWCRCSVLVG